MPNRAAIERGLAFEPRAAEALGLRQTLASGSQHHDRSDAKGRVRLSCKATTGRTWAETRADLDDAISLAAGTGETPMLAVLDDDGAELIVMRLVDASELLTEEAKVIRTPKRGDRVRQAALTPTIHRDDA